MRVAQSAPTGSDLPSRPRGRSAPPGSTPTCQPDLIARTAMCDTGQDGLGRSCRSVSPDRKRCNPHWRTPSARSAPSPAEFAAGGSPRPACRDTGRSARRPTHPPRRIRASRCSSSRTGCSRNTVPHGTRGGRSRSRTTQVKSGGSSSGAVVTVSGTMTSMWSIQWGAARLWRLTQPVYREGSLRSPRFRAPTAIIAGESAQLVSPLPNMDSTGPLRLKRISLYGRIC
jgi:hypothetical protein